MFFEAYENATAEKSARWPAVATSARRERAAGNAPASARGRSSTSAANAYPSSHGSGWSFSSPRT